MLLPRARRWASHISLIGLLIAEILVLTILFDTASLERVPSVWARLIGWAPQYLHIVITVLGLILFFNQKQLWEWIRANDEDCTPEIQLQYLIAHVSTMLLFYWLTGQVMQERSAASNDLGSGWAIAWFLTGAATLLVWCLAMMPRRTWFAAFSKGRNGIIWGIVLGCSAWGIGLFTEKLWSPLATLTFTVVSGILHLTHAQVVSDPARFVIGTSTFRVLIAQECSGYEGIGLVVAFLSIYLWLFRKDLRFPKAFLLFPAGAIAIWILNAFRIAALVIIGASGWPEIAKGGFHSQAGWLSFNAVSLGLVAITMRGGYFMKSKSAVRVADVGSDPTTAYLAPFLAIVGTAMLTGAFTAGFQWLYPLRIIAAGSVLWLFRKNYIDLKWKWSWQAVAIGLITFLMWVLFLPADAANDKAEWPLALQSVSIYSAATWVVFRIIGYVVVVPLAEELAFRGFLTRRIMRADFHDVPIGTFSWFSFLLSSLLFGIFHGKLWLAGTGAGMLFALALYRRRSLGDAIQSHAATNAMLAVYAVVTGHWSAWS